MNLANQLQSLRRTLNALYPTWPVYLERVPQGFVRPSFYVGVDRVTDQQPGPAQFESQVDWGIAYFATSHDDALSVADALSYQLLQSLQGLITYWDYSTVPETATMHFLRVVALEASLDQDETQQWNVAIRLRTVLRLPKELAQAPLIGKVYVSENVT